MDKQAYKDMIAEYMKRESKLKTKVEELDLKLEQQSQDFHFDMRNKQMELVMLQNRLDTLEAANVTLTQGFDDLEKENKELRKTIGEVDG